jgi:predicted metalloprotease with PDZ domain
MLLFTTGPLGLKLRDESRESKDGIGVSIYEVKDGCPARDAGLEVGYYYLPRVAIVFPQVDARHTFCLTT